MTMHRRHFLILAAAATATANVGGAAPARAAPSADPWDIWAAHDPGSRQVVDHGAWRAFLERYLVVPDDGPHLVRYAAAAADGRGLIDDAVGHYAGLAVRSLNRDEQRAVWTNLYNALTVRVVLAHYPVASIRDIDISPGWFTNGPWGAKLVTVEGIALSLDDIEHRILRPFWRDPRVHYAVNCAALGCPSLQPEPFTGVNAEPLLDRAAAAFVASREGVRFDGDRLLVSSIYRWFSEDFGGWADGVLRHLRAHAVPPLAARLARRDHIDGHRYDWRLNDAAPAAGRRN